MKKKIIIGSDKSGFVLKESVKAWLTGNGYEVTDIGMQNMEDFQPYFQVAPKLAKKIQQGEFEKGILFCGTGMGMCITANKFKGVYAAVVESMYAAKMCSVVNRANVLTLGGWVTAPEQAYEMIRIWLETPFGAGFPEDRVEFLTKAFGSVKEIEEENFSK